MCKSSLHRVLGHASRMKLIADIKPLATGFVYAASCLATTNFPVAAKDFQLSPKQTTRRYA